MSPEEAHYNTSVLAGRHSLLGLQWSALFFQLTSANRTLLGRCSGLEPFSADVRSLGCSRKDRILW